MGAVWGSPDFGARQATGEFELYAPYEPGPYLLWPMALAVGTRDGGRPDLQIVLVRASGSGPDYGLFDLGIQRQQDTAGALAFLRTIDSSATVAVAPFESGFIRLVAGAGMDEPPADLLKPTPIGWGGIDAARWMLPLSADGAEILEAGLTSALPLTVRTEVEVRGLAPRVPCTAVFDPAALLTAVIGGAGSRQVPRTALDDFFLQPIADLPWLKIEGGPPADRQAFALAMSGRVRMEYGRFVPSPGAEGPAFVELADVPAGIVRWNLAEPAAILRAWVFTLDPFTAARQLAAVAGTSALYREVTTAPLSLGFFNVDVQAFLPAPRLGVVDVGVAIQVPARPPLQPQGDSHSVVFQPPDDHSVVQLRVPPLSKLAYVYRTYADVLEGSHVRRVDASPVNETTATLRLQGHDLPIDLLEMSADPALLAQASLSGTLSYVAPSGAAVSTSFVLDAAHARVAVALPRDAVSPSVAFDAHASPADGSAAIHLGPLPASGQHVTLGSFQEYGGHVVSITGAFEPGAAGPFGIDLIADGQLETPAAIATLFLTKDLATAEWSYLAASPFHAGYRWRAHPGGTWSAPLPPGAPLRVDVQAGPAAAPQVWDLEGAHVYHHPGDPPGRVRYVPAAPTPQLDGQGRPTLMLVDTGAIGMLAIGTRLELSDAQRNDLEVALLERLSGVDRITFQAGAFTVGPVTLSLADGHGGYDVLATTPSMGAPPYNATFSVQLRGDQRTRALAAINGSTGLLKVDYPLTLSPELAATLEGNPAAIVRTVDVADWFPGGTGAAHIQRLGV